MKKNKKECPFREDQKVWDPDLGRYVCPGKDKHDRVGDSGSSMSSTSSSYSTSSNTNSSNTSNPLSFLRKKQESEEQRQAREWQKAQEEASEQRRRIQNQQSKIELEILEYNKGIHKEIELITEALLAKYKRDSKGGVILNGLKQVEKFQRELATAIKKVEQLQDQLKLEKGKNWGTTREIMKLKIRNTGRGNYVDDEYIQFNNISELCELYGLQTSVEKLKEWCIFLKELEERIQQEADVLYQLSKLHNDGPDNHEDIDKVLAKAEKIKSQIHSATRDIECYGTKSEHKYKPDQEARKLQISGLNDAEKELDEIITKFKRRKEVVKPGFKKVAEFAAQQAVQYIQTRGAELAKMFDYPVESYDVEVRPKEGKNTIPYQEFEAVFPDDETASIEKFLEIMEAVIVGKGRGMQDNEATRINVKLKSSEPLKLAAIDLMNYNAFVEGSNKELEKAIEKVNQLIKEGTNSAAIVEEGNKFRKKLQEVIQRLRDYKTKQDKKENLDYLLGMEKEMEEKIKLEEHKIFIKNINEEVDRAGARTGELAKSGNDPLATIQEANKFKDKLEEMIERVRRYEHKRDKIIEDLTGIIKEVEQIISEQKEKLDKLNKEKREEEAKIRKEWDKLLDEIQNKFGHLTINSVEEGLRTQKELKAYETKVKLYESYNFISKSSINQVLGEITKGYKTVSEILETYQDKLNYDALIDELMAEIKPLADELNRLQDEGADRALIIAKAEAAKPKIEGALKRLEDFKTKRDKSESLANLREAKSQVEGIIRDRTKMKVLLVKYKSALQQVAINIKQRIDEEKAEIAREAGKPIEKYSLTIAPKPGLNLQKLEELFPDERNSVDLQKLLDTVEVQVEILSEEETDSSGEKEDKKEAGKAKEVEVATNREDEKEDTEKEKVEIDEEGEKKNKGKGKEKEKEKEKEEGEKKLFTNPTGKGIRNDRGGLGHFGAPRGKRLHQGLDLLATVGQDVVAPFNGKLRNMIGNETKKPMIQIYPENKALPFERLEILYVDKPEDVQWDVFRYVHADDVVGTASNLRKWYSPEVGNHVHVQILKKDEARIDPKPFFFSE